MLAQLNEKLALLKEQDRQRQKLQTIYEKVNADLADQTRKQRGLNQVLQREASDVADLTGFSLKGVFYTILGTKEIQLREEKQEHLAAQLKYSECTEVVQDLEGEKQSLEQQLTQFANLDSDLKAVLDAKEEILASLNDATTLKLNQITEEGIKAELGCKELEEAIIAGELSLQSLKEVIDSLESAQDWGTWDMLGGGGMATMLKHSNLDEAREHMHRTQQLLRKFSYELEDVNKHQDVLINIDGFDTFSDYFFDSLIFDWLVQEKINQSLKNTEELYARIQHLLTDLTQKKDQLRKLHEEKIKERQQLIETA